MYKLTENEENDTKNQKIFYWILTGFACCLWLLSLLLPALQSQSTDDILGGSIVIGLVAAGESIFFAFGYLCSLPSKLQNKGVNGVEVLVAIYMLLLFLTNFVFIANLIWKKRWCRVLLMISIAIIILAPYLPNLGEKPLIGYQLWGLSFAVLALRSFGKHKIR